MFNDVYSATVLGTSSIVVHQWSVNRSSIGPERMSHERMVVDRASVGEWYSPMSVDRSSEDRLYTPMSVDRMSVDLASMVYQSPNRPMMSEDRSMSLDSRQSPISYNSAYPLGWMAGNHMSSGRPSSKGSPIEGWANTLMSADRTPSIGPIPTGRPSVGRAYDEPQRPPPYTSYARHVNDDITLPFVLFQSTFTYY
jgi:hypothetical protein